MRGIDHNYTWKSGTSFSEALCPTACQFDRIGNLKNFVIYSNGVIMVEDNEGGLYIWQI